MELLFCHSRSIGGLIIRTALMSRWNHVALRLGNCVFDATLSDGVALWGVNEFHTEWRHIESRRIEVADERPFYNFLFAQLGKPYDWQGFLGLPFRQNWASTQRWFCSELIAAAFQHAGYPLGFPSRRVTPRDLHVLFPLECRYVLD